MVVPAPWEDVVTSFDVTEVVDAGGWDMVVGLPLSAINTALAAVASGLDLTFSYTGQNDGQSYAIAGNFGPWSITGGSGQDLTLSLPVAGGTFSASGTADGPFALPSGPFDLAGLSVAVATRLAFRGQAGDPRASELVFAFDGRSAQAPAETGAPSAGQLCGGAALPSLVRDLLPAAIASCLSANIDKMDFVFATLAAGIGEPSGPAASGARWQYLVAGQQTNSATTLLICYAAFPGPGISAGVPAPVCSAEGNQCVVVLSQPATLDTVLIPAIAKGLEQAQFPMSPAVGVGPELPASAGRPSFLSATSFKPVPGPVGANSASIQAPAPIVLDLVGYSQSTSVTISDFVCEIGGNRAEFTFEAATTDDPQDTYTVSQVYNLTVGENRLGVETVLGVAFVPSGQPSVQNTHQGGWPGPRCSAPIEFFKTRISGSITAGLQNSPLPFSISVFGNQRISPVQGYLNGGLAFAGPLTPVPPA